MCGSGHKGLIPAGAAAGGDYKGNQSPVSKWKTNTLFFFFNLSQ